MSRVETVLEKFGLSKSEIKVYLEILKNKETTHSLVSSNTKIPRTTVYDIVQSLVNKNLISQKNSKLVSNSPNKLKEIIKKRFGELQELEEDITSIVPNLIEKEKNYSVEVSKVLWEGVEGARRAYFASDFQDIVQTRFIITDLNSTNTFGEEEIEQSFSYDVKELVPVNDWVKYLFKTRLKKNSEFVKHKEYRYIEHPLFIQYTRTTVIGDKVLHACAYKNEAWGLMIDSKAYSFSVKSIFDYLWSRSKKLSVKTIKNWPEITTPTGTIDTPSVVIEDGQVHKF